MEAPGFWDDAEAAQEKSKLLKGLKDDVETCAHLYQQYEDIETLIQMGYEENDEELAQEAREELTASCRRWTISRSVRCFRESMTNAMRY